LGVWPDEWTTESVYQALLAGTKFDPNVEGSWELHIKQDEEIKYISVEVGHPDRAAVPMPRYSVEPMTIDAPRGTDELVEGSTRRTDELQQVNSRWTDEPAIGVGHHRNSEDLAMHAISVWPSQDSPRIKQDH
jgi:hypothetical protein